MELSLDISVSRDYKGDPKGVEACTIQRWYFIANSVIYIIHRLGLLFGSQGMLSACPHETSNGSVNHGSIRLSTSWLDYGGVYWPPPAACMCRIHHQCSSRMTIIMLISIDYSKAFDSVRHSSLIQKMSVMDLPDNIYSWIANYFEKRGHVG